MNSRFLLISLLALLASVAIESPLLFALSMISVVIGIALAGSAPRRAVFGFWIWTVAVLLFLFFTPPAGTLVPGTETGLVAGLPLPALAMIIGIWIIPILIWPLAFLVDFDRWMGK